MAREENGITGDAGLTNDAGSLSRATAVMSVGTALSRVTGFVRIGVMAWAIGGAESKLPDTYNLANSMPNMVYQLVVGEVLATIFVPVFVEYLKKRAREEAWRLASSILNLAVLFASAFVAITVLAAPWIIKIYTFRVTDPAERAMQEQVGAFFLRLFMVQMVFYAMGSVLTGLLNAHRRFAAPMFAPLLNNLIVTATFVIFRLTHGAARPTLESLTTADKLLLGGGTTLGIVAMTMVLWPAVRRLPGRYEWRALEWRHPAIRHVGTLARYSLAYVVVNQVGLWVVYMLANQERGGVSAYQAAWILYQLPYGIFAVSVMTALMPALSSHHVDGDLASVRADVSRGLRLTAFIVLPAAAGFVALGRPIIKLLLEHGVFTGASTDLYADTFQTMAIGLAFYAAFQMIMRAFYAMQDTKTPWQVNLVWFVASVATAIPLFDLYGMPGLGLSHAISYIVAALYGGAVLRKRIGGLDGKRLLSAHLKIGTAAVVTGLVAWVVAAGVDSAIGVASLGEQVVQVATAVLAGLVLYAGVARALRVEEFGALTATLMGRFSRRRA